jgi:AbiU2
MSPQTPEDQLRDQVHGLCDNIFKAEQAYKLAFAIGSHANELNQANYGVAFRVIQLTLEQSVVLAITKLFEPPHRKYPTRSIPAAMALLERSADHLTINQPVAVQPRLRKIGVTLLPNASDPEITRALVGRFNVLLPSHKTLEGLSHLRRLDALRFRRDKVIAHNESIGNAEFPNVNWGDIRKLLDLAKSFVDIVSVGYLNLFQTVDDGRFLLDEDAAEAATAIQRAFQAMFTLSSS